MKRIHTGSASLAWLVLLASSVILSAFSGIGASRVAAADDAPRLTGHWVLNEELTRQAQPENRQSASLLDNLPRTTISVGGVPLPGSGSTAPQGSGGTAPDPKILRCDEVTIEAAGEDLLITYLRLGSDTLKRGNDQGLISKWNDRRLTSRYQTTTRKVRQRYEVTADEHLLVTVKLNPKRGATTVHKRVFERAAD